MNRIRAFFKLLGFSVCTLLTMAAVTAGKGVLAGRDETFVTWKNRVLGWWASSCMRLMGIRMVVEGNPPDPPFILVTNHLSYLDVVPLWYLTDATFIAKSELRSWPFFGWATTMLGVIFIDRENRRDVHRVNREIDRNLRLGQGVIFFPEGTSTPGAEVVPFKAPLFHHAARNGRPVHYASISYKSGDPSRPASHSVCWWGDMDFFGHFLELLTLKRIQVTLRFGEEPVASGDRKELAAELRERVIRIFEPVH